MEIRVSICPHCGKAPKAKLIKRTRFLKPPVFEAIIICKPVIGRAHMKSQFTSDIQSDAIDAATNDWNTKAKDILKNKHVVKMSEDIC